MLKDFEWKSRQYARTDGQWKRRWKVWKNQKMLGNKNAVIEMENHFYGLISKVYITQEDPLSLRRYQWKLPKLSSRGDWLNKIQQNSQELCSDCKVMTCIKECQREKRRRKGTEAIFEAIVIDNFPKLMTHQSTDHEQPVVELCRPIHTQIFFIFFFITYYRTT